ncbi:MAG: YEATS-associated helix-containing protein [Bacteroidota bacterium]
MKSKSHYILVGIVLALLVLMMILRNNEKFLGFFENPTAYPEARADSKELERRDKDKILYAELRKRLVTDTQKELSSILNGAEIEQDKADVEATSKALVNMLMPAIEEKITLKNKTITQLEIKAIESETSINYPLIVLIIFVSGILGGYARRYYDDLEEIGKEVKNYENMTTNALAKIEQIPHLTETVAGQTRLRIEANDGNDTLKPFAEAVDSGLESLKADVTSLKKYFETLTAKIQAVKNNQEGNNNIFANLIYGIIAASFSILGLNMAKSSVLEFSSGTDYLILWGWATIFAIFSKSIVEALANNIKSKIKTPKG